MPYDDNAADAGSGLPHHRPSYGQTSALPTQQSTTNLVGFWITFGLLTAAGALFSLFFGFVSVMASDACMGGASGWLCHTGGQQAAVLIPWLGWVLAIVASLVGFGFRRRQQPAPWLGLGVGALIYILVVAGEYAAVQSLTG